MQMLGHGNPFHEALYAMLLGLSEGHIKFGLQTVHFSIQLSTSAGCALQHALTLLCHFTWPITWWLSCCCSQLLLLWYNTTNS
ncbi:unnamed protein product [Staurois parvus]|uniref:Uncharacterized protein n=1 Tax=Staurois parvus TaxID=386267 RepID=A0ABN9GA72_9NEOB|nr:unnamed protein product [Staurois parvus]